MERFLRDFAQQVRLADALDVAIIAILFYATFVWLRERASRSLGIVALCLACIFLLASWLQLYLTLLAFHYGLLGILLALVVVFQHDIRHGFERLTAHPWFRRSAAHEPTQEMANTLTAAIAEMARARIGALLVLPGVEPLDRHLRGGVEADAKVSLQLLLSIFHPKSPGHDGAVVVENARITQFAVHLPLTAQVHRLGGGGTRHAAALGLAECSDALVVAVSEERGTISLARGGALSEVQAAELAECLEQMFAGQTAGRDKRPPTRLRDWFTKAAALATAVSLWLLFAYNTDTLQRTFVVPIEYRNLPAGWELMEPKPTHVELTLSGSQPAFSLLDPTTVAVSLEAEDIGQNQVMRWQTQSNLKNVPGELSVEQIAPETVVVAVRRKPSPAN